MQPRVVPERRGNAGADGMFETGAGRGLAGGGKPTVKQGETLGPGIAVAFIYFEGRLPLNANGKFEEFLSLIGVT